MKRTSMVFALLAGVAFGAVPQKAYATFTIDYNAGMNVFKDKRIEGFSQHFGFMFDFGNNLSVGYYFETAALQLDAEIGAAVPDYSRINLTINSVRAVQNFGKFVGVGVDLGTAKVRQGPTGGTNFAATTALNQTVPMLQVLGVGRAGTRVTDNVSAEMQVQIGYRFINMNDFTLSGAQTGEALVTGLDGATINLGISIKF